jgi:seryl-tRNA synthetase
VQQLQELKNLHAETKKTYNATFDALKDNDRIFKSIENVSHSKLTTGKKHNDADAVRRHYEAEIERTRS